MDFKQYQEEAVKSDLNPNSQEGLLISLFGIAGEAGELLSRYKKRLRDGESYTAFNDSIKEELGDLLWYLSNVASKFGFTLDEIAEANLSKVKNRWLAGSESVVFDAEFPKTQQFPRQLKFSIIRSKNNTSDVAITYYDGNQVGDPLTDNSYSDDGYRFHDIFHLSYLAVLGWSPVIRKHIFKKRKSNEFVDEVEDGGRAIVIEEGVAALVYGYAKNHNWLEGIRVVDEDLLKAIRIMTSHLEVNTRTEREWEDAILKGFKVWRDIQKYKEGEVVIDMDKKSILFQPSATATDRV